MQEERKFAQAPTNKSYSFFIYIFGSTEKTVCLVFLREGISVKKKRGAWNYIQNGRGNKQGKDKKARRYTQSTWRLWEWEVLESWAFFTTRALQVPPTTPQFVFLFRFFRDFCWNFLFKKIKVRKKSRRTDERERMSRFSFPSSPT